MLFLEIQLGIFSPYCDSCCCCNIIIVTVMFSLLYKMSCNSHVLYGLYVRTCICARMRGGSIVSVYCVSRMRSNTSEPVNSRVGNRVLKEANTSLQGAAKKQPPRRPLKNSVSDTRHCPPP